MIVPVAYTTFNAYLVKKRALMMNVTKAVIGLTTMCYPMFVECLMKQYGWRGALAVIAAVDAHVILAMLVMHPIEWHYRKRKASEKDPNNSNKNQTIKEYKDSLQL